MPIGENNAIVTSYEINTRTVGRGNRVISTQTSCVANRSTHTIAVSEKSIQTTTKTKRSSDNTGNTSCEKLNFLSYSKSLLHFLRNASQNILTEMNASAESFAFDEFNCLEIEKTKEAKVSHACSLQWEKSTYQMKKEKIDPFFENDGLHNQSENIQYGLDITGIDWNSSGSILGASFGKENDIGWCTRTGAIVLWRVNMQKST